MQQNVETEDSASKIAWSLTYLLTYIYLWQLNYRLQPDRWRTCMQYAEAC